MKSKSAPNLYEILKGSRSSKAPAAIPEKKEKEPVAAAVKAEPEVKVKEAPEPPKKPSVEARPEPKPIPDAPEKEPVKEERAEVATTAVEEKPPIAPREPVAAVTAPSPEPVRVQVAPSPQPQPRIMVKAPDPIKPPSAQESPSGPGERVVSITYNTIGFSVLIVLGLLFIAYTVGLRQGRNEGPAAPDETAMEGEGIDEVHRSVADNPSPAPVPAPAPVAAQEEKFSIQLMKWKADSSREEISNKANAQTLKDLLKRRGMKDGWFRLETGRSGKYVVLYYGNYTRADGQKVIDTLGKLRGFQYTRSSDNKISTPFRNASKADLVLLEG